MKDKDKLMGEFTRYWQQEGTFCDNPFTGKKETAYGAWQAAKESSRKELELAQGLLKAEQDENASLRASRETYWKGQEVAKQTASNATFDILSVRKDLFQCQAEIAYLKAQLAKFQMSEFHPDWSMLQASQESLREHMQIINDLKAQLAEAQNMCESCNQISGW